MCILTAGSKYASGKLKKPNNERNDVRFRIPIRKTNYADGRNKAQEPLADLESNHGRKREVRGNTFSSR